MKKDREGKWRGGGCARNLARDDEGKKSRSVAGSLGRFACGRNAQGRH